MLFFKVIKVEEVSCRRNELRREVTEAKEVPPELRGEEPGSCAWGWGEGKAGPTERATVCDFLQLGKWNLKC